MLASVRSGERGALAAFPALRDADPAERAVARERQELLRRELLRLPSPQRLVLICRYLLDLDESETAVVLGWPRGTVKSRLHRALRRLSELLGRPAPDRVDAGPPPGPGIEAKEADHEV